MPNTNATPDEESPPEMKGHFVRLHATCSETLDKSFDEDAVQKMAQSYLFVTDLQAWTQFLADKPENKLFQAAEQEYMTALLSLTQGQG